MTILCDNQRSLSDIQMLSAFMREYFKNMSKGPFLTNDITWAQQIWTFCDCFILQIWDALSEW